MSLSIKETHFEITWGIALSIFETSDEMKENLPEFERFPFKGKVSSLDQEALWASVDLSALEKLGVTSEVEVESSENGFLNIIFTSRLLNPVKIIEEARDLSSLVWNSDPEDVPTIEAALYEIGCASNSRASPDNLWFEYVDLEKHIPSTTYEECFAIMERAFFLSDTNFVSTMRKRKII